MKVLIVLTILLFILQIALAQPPKSKAKIKSSVEYFYNIPDKITSTRSNKWTMRVEVHYDTAGRTTWEIMHDKSDKSMNITTKYIYDKEGRLLKWYGETNLLADYSYAYDRQGRLVITDHKEKHDVISKIIDEKHNVDTQFLYDSSGALISTKIYKYNPVKTVYQITEFGKDGDLKKESTETYDDQHRRMDQIIFNKDGSRKSHETVKYQQDGFVRIDSNQRYISGPPIKINGDKITSFTYKYPKLDKYGNPLVTSFLYGDKYVIAGVKEYKYY